MAEGKNPAADGSRPHVAPTVKVGPKGGEKKLNIKPSKPKKG
jgi:hypothetical protein